MNSYHALLYFDTEINLGLGTHPDVWVNYKTVDYTDGRKAFSDYIYELEYCPTSVYLVSGDSYEELLEREIEICKKFNDPAWREKYV